MKRSIYSHTFESLLRRTAVAVATVISLTAGPALAQTAPGDAPPPAGDSTATVDAPLVDDSATPVPAAPDSLAAPATPTASHAVSNPRMTGVRKVRLIGGERNVVRSGPGDTYSISGVYPGGAEFPVIAKSGPWYNIRLSDTETAWVHASLCREFDDLSDLQFRPNPKLYSRTGSFILAGNAGGYSFDRKSNSLVLGGRFGYYVFDRLQVEGGVSWTHVNRPAEIVETLFGLTLEAENFDMLFYHLIASWELMPGRQMVPYLTGGVGSSIMQGESEPSFNFGGGTTLYLSKRTAMRWEVRDYRFTSGSTNARRNNNNIEFTLGSLLLF